MGEALALIRAGWLSASSYRLNMAFSLAGLLATFVPLYFVAGALQPVAAESIRNEGGEYFGFLLIGLAVLGVMATAINVLPTVIASSIGSGTLEVLLTTRARLPAVILGLVGYDLCWATTRAVLLVLAGTLLGMQTHLAGLPLTLLAFALIILAYLGIGLGLAAMILAFRTVGPIATGIVAGSALLGGAYYSTTVIPSWIQDLASVVPLTYGLRVMRKALLQGELASASVSSDMLILAGLAAALLLIGAGLFRLALSHARAEGSLGQY